MLVWSDRTATVTPYRVSAKLNAHIVNSLCNNAESHLQRANDENDYNGLDRQSASHTAVLLRSLNNQLRPGETAYGMAGSDLDGCRFDCSGALPQRDKQRRPVQRFAYVYHSTAIRVQRLLWDDRGFCRVGAAAPVSEIMRILRSQAGNSRARLRSRHQNLMLVRLQKLQEQLPYVVPCRPDGRR